MFPDIAKYVTVYLFSMVKFFFGPLTGAASGLTWVETCAFTVLGMMTSVLIFSALGKNLRAKIMHRFFRRRRLFTPRNRRLVYFWRRYGLLGVAFLTPIIFSPIIGTVVAASFGEPIQRIFVYMLGSALFWGVIMSVLVHELGQIVL